MGAPFTPGANLGRDGPDKRHYRYWSDAQINAAKFFKILTNVSWEQKIWP